MCVCDHYPLFPCTLTPYSFLPHHTMVMITIAFALLSSVCIISPFRHSNLFYNCNFTSASMKTCLLLTTLEGHLQNKIYELGVFINGKVYWNLYFLRLKASRRVGSKVSAYIFLISAIQTLETRTTCSDNQHLFLSKRFIATLRCPPIQALVYLL